jgi:hypothetical protein
MGDLEFMVPEPVDNGIESRGCGSRRGGGEMDNESKAEGCRIGFGEDGARNVPVDFELIGGDGPSLTDRFAMVKIEERQNMRSV